MKTYYKGYLIEPSDDFARYADTLKEAVKIINEIE